jgi:hypothetical protein
VNSRCFWYFDIFFDLRPSIQRSTSRKRPVKTTNALENVGKDDIWSKRRSYYSTASQPVKNTKNNIIICIYFLAWEALYNIVNILATIIQVLSYKCKDISPHFLPQTDKRKGFKFNMLEIPLEFHTILWFGRFAEYKLLFTGVKTCMKLQCATIFKRGI